MHIHNKIKPVTNKARLVSTIQYSWTVSERNRRFLMLAASTLLLILISIVDVRSISWSGGTFLSRFSLTVGYAFSLLTSLLFFGVGAIVWLYGRQRKVATLLFGFCYMMALAFISSIGIDAGNTFLNAIGSSCCALAGPFLTLLLLSFPTNTFAQIAPRRAQYIALQVYLIFIIFLSLFAVIFFVDTYILRFSLPAICILLVIAYYGICIIGIILSVFFSSRHVTTIRTHQQFRLLLSGILLSFAPIFILTLLPMLLHLPFVVDGRQSMLFLIFFPLTFGYAILRYQLLIFDTYIRRYVDWMMTAILLSLATYIVLTVCSFIFVNSTTLLIIAVTLFLPIPALWIVRTGRKWIEHFFFSEMLHYRHLVEKLPLEAQNLYLSQIAQALTAAMRETFSAPAACIFVFDETHQCYTLFPPQHERELHEQEANLLSSLGSVFPTMRSSAPFSLDAGLPMMSILQSSLRPMSMQELFFSNGSEAPGISRYMTLDQPPAKEHDLLFIPLRVQDAMVAILLLDERGNQEQYAGPDFEGMNLLLTRFLPLFETAWLIQKLQATNEQLQSANERLSELDLLKNQFITSTSHELRTPLTAVAGYIDLLLEHTDSLSHEQHSEFLRKASVACDELVQQVKVISDAGRLQFEIKHVTLSPCSLNEILAQATEIMGVEALHQQRSIQLDLPVPITVFASAHHVREILLNLLSNAFKYSPQGTPVIIHVVPQKDCVMVSVEDSGFGVPPEAHKNLFEQFVRLERDMNSPVRGAGLGLAICKQLVEAMGGRIWITSSGISGEGSTFSFTLPYSS